MGSACSGDKGTVQKKPHKDQGTKGVQKTPGPKKSDPETQHKGKLSRGDSNTSNKSNASVVRKRTKVKINIGPLEIGEGGFALKPKFDIGVTAPWIYLNAGVKDVRDGLTMEALGSAHKDYAVSGNTMQEIFTEVKAVDPLPVLDDLVEFVPKVVGWIMEKFSVDITSETKEIEGVIVAFIAVGIKAGLYLGWVNTEGYRMFGASGMIATALTAGITTKIGIHESGNSLRVVQFVSNVGVDIIIHLKKKIDNVPEKGDDFEPEDADPECTV